MWYRDHIGVWGTVMAFQWVIRFESA